MTAIKSRLFRFIPQCSTYRQLAFVFTFILLLVSLGTISSCDKKSAPPTSPTSNEVSDRIQSEESPIAYQPLALARYRLLLQIERQTGESPFPGKSFSARDDVLFPLGRSDKAYILNRGYKFTKDGYPFVKLICYKSQGEGVKLLYSVKLKNVNKPAKDKIRVQNMADYLSLLGENKGDHPFGPYSYAVPTNISKVTKRDLSMNQGFVAYSCDSNVDIYHIQCFCSKEAQSIDDSKYIQSFDGPGFPVADCELKVKVVKKK